MADIQNRKIKYRERAEWLKINQLKKKSRQMFLLLILKYLKNSHFSIIVWVRLKALGESTEKESVSLSLIAKLKSQIKQICKNPFKINSIHQWVHLPSLIKSASRPQPNLSSNWNSPKREESRMPTPKKSTLKYISYCLAWPRNKTDRSIWYLWL